MAQMTYDDYVQQIQAALQQSRQAQAAQQAWNQTPWYLKPAVAYGNGANNVLQNDVVQPARNFLAEPAMGFVSPQAAQQSAEDTEAGNRAFSSLQGIGPKAGSMAGEAATLLPAAMVTGGAAEGAMPAAEGAGGLLAAMRAYAPLSAGGATMGALEPDNRAVSALAGAAVPFAGGLMGKVAGTALPSVMNNAYRLGALSPRAASLMAEIPTQMRGYSTAVRSYIPKSLQDLLGPPADVAKDVGKKTVTRGPKQALQQVLFPQFAQQQASQ